MAVACAALLCGVMGSPLTAQSRSNAACRESGVRWTQPVTRPGVRFVWPELLLARGTPYAFGFVPEGVAASRGIVALRGGMEELGLPPGAAGFFDPVLAVDRAGTLHALWGEHEGKANPDEDPRLELYRLDRVLYAHRRNGRWSRAQVVYRATSVHWRRLLLSRLEEDTDGNLHGAFAARQSLNVLVHLRLGSQGWRTTELAGEPFRPGAAPSGNPFVAASGGTYPRLAIGRRGRIYLAMVTAARPAAGGSIPGGETNSLWVRRSDDAGLTWTAPILVHRSGRMAGFEPQIVATGRDTVHLLWQRRLNPHSGGDEIRHAISTDGGVTWGSAIELRAPGPYPLHNLRAVATAKGELYIAFAHQPGAIVNGQPRKPGPVNDQIFYAHWGRRGWSEPRLLRPEVGVLPFDLRIDGADRLHLLWPYMAPPDSGEGAARRVLSYAVASVCRP